MIRVLHIWIIIILLPLLSQADEKYDFVSLDKETYRLYMEQKWDSLIEVGTDGLKQGFDYYYLRYRLGVAYYELQNYARAAKHFERAFEFSPDERSLLEYLYYSNYFLNRQTKSTWYARQMPEKKQKDLLFFGNDFLKEVYLESGYVLSNDKELNPPDEMWTDSSSYLENHFAGNRFFTHAGAKLGISPRVSAYAGYSFLIAEKESNYNFYGDLQTDSIVSTQFTDDYYYSFELKKRRIESTTRQHEIYLKMDVLLDKNWIVTPFLHYLRVNYKTERVRYIPHQEQAVLYYDKLNDSAVYFNYIGNDYRFRQKDTLLNDYVAGISLNRIFPCLEIKAGASISRLNLKDRYNFFASAGYYPFGNLNLYGNTSLAYYTSATGDAIEKDNKFVFAQEIGFRLTGFMWMEAGLFYGGLDNTWWNNAFVVYNVPDEIEYIAGAEFIILLSDYLQLNIQYQYWQKKGAAFHYYLDEIQQPQNETIQTNYQNQMITGGLKWKI